MKHLHKTLKMRQPGVYHDTMYTGSYKHGGWAGRERRIGR